MKTLLTSTLLTLLILDARAQLPTKPNLIDENGNKQGEWIYYFTNKWKKTKKPDRASYYRLISYIDSKPIGNVIDYYLTGQEQMQADSLTSEDPEQYHGQVLVYSEEGFVNQISVYNGGNLDTTKTVETFLKYIQQYKNEIPEHLDLAFLANDLAFLYLDQKKYNIAESYYELAKNIRAKQLGPNHIQYGISCYKLAYVLQKQSKSEQALPLFEEAARVFLASNGKKDESYQNAIRYINEIKAGNSR